MRRFLILMFAVVVLISCAGEDSAVPELQFPITEKQSLKFQYYYDYVGENNWIDTFRLITVNTNLNGKLYSAFYYINSNTPPPFTLHLEDDRLDFNFLPLRYDDGKYYELQRKGEVIILKDDIKKGDKWTNYLYDEGLPATMYRFEVINRHSVFQAGQTEYKDVFEIKETISSLNNPGSGEYVSYHFYNYEFGIVRREIPMYQSGTYGPMTFNRIL